MASEWQELTIDDVADVVGGGTPSTKDESNFNGEIPWITPKDLSGCTHRYIARGERNISQKGLQNSSARILPKDTVLLTTRAPVGYLAIVSNPITTNQGFRSLILREGFNPEFFYYLLKSNTDYLKTHASGTTFGELSGSTLKGLKFLIPPLPEQRAIAHILGTLDDKIELNRRMNQTLEAIAQALFKSWFVDFEPFRDQGMQGSPLGEIPVGWIVVSIKDIAKRVGMGPFGSSIKVETFVPEGIPIISGQHLNQTLLEDNHYNFITPQHAEELKNSNVFRGDIIFTHAGNIGQVAYIPETSQYERYVISQRQFYLRCDLTKISPLFVIYFFKTPQGQHALLANTSSTGVAHPPKTIPDIIS